MRARGSGMPKSIFKKPKMRCCRLRRVLQALCRHRQWQTIREQVANADTVRDLHESVRDRLDHPDLQAFDVAKETAPTVVA